MSAWEKKKQQHKWEDEISIKLNERIWETIKRNRGKIRNKNKNKYAQETEREIEAHAIDPPKPHIAPQRIKTAVMISQSFGPNNGWLNSTRRPPRVKGHWTVPTILKKEIFIIKRKKKKRKRRKKRFRKIYSDHKDEKGKRDTLTTPSGKNMTNPGVGYDCVIAPTFATRIPASQSRVRR